MSEAAKKGAGLVALAIIVAAIVVSASVLLAFSPYGFGPPRTVTVTETNSSTEAPSVGVSFPRNESGISQFCRFGELVTGGDKQESQNASGQIITTYHEPVLVMRVPSTGYACVTYESLYTGPEMGTQPRYFNFSVNICHRIGQTGLGCAPSQALTSTAFPSTVTLFPSMPNFTVIYTITAPAGSTGLYDGAGDIYWGYPLAVGYQPSQLNSSDFHIILSAHSGANEPLRATSVSVIGMAWTYVEFQCPPSPQVCISGS